MFEKFQCPKNTCIDFVSEEGGEALVSLHLCVITKLPQGAELIR